MSWARLVCVAGTVLAMVFFLWPSAQADVGGELVEIERHVSYHPTDTASRQRLAEAYAERGFVEEAVAAYVAIVAQGGDEGEARARIQALLTERMPDWLPAVAGEMGLFPHARFELTAGDGGGTRALLRTTAGFAAGEGERRDRAHGWRFPLVDYGYTWGFSRWVMSVRAHRDAGVDAVTAANALTAVMCLHAIAGEYLGRDPARPLGQPIDLWLTTNGQPGARSVGRDIYLYAAHVPRAPAEWLRELAHEYGHTSLPGIGGFTETDDPWADGDLGELLFVKWLADGGQPQSLPWPVADAEREAKVRRGRLMAGAQGPLDLQKLSRPDAQGRDYFLGLALRVEKAAGPRFLAEALARCPRGRAVDFVATVDALARARGLDAWGATAPEGEPNASPPT